MSRGRSCRNYMVQGTGIEPACSKEPRGYGPLPYRYGFPCTTWRVAKVSIPHPLREPAVFKAARRAVCGTTQTWRKRQEFNLQRLSPCPLSRRGGPAKCPTLPWRGAAYSKRKPDGSASLSRRALSPDRFTPQTRLLHKHGGEPSARCPFPKGTIGLANRAVSLNG